MARPLRVSRPSWLLPALAVLACTLLLAGCDLFGPDDPGELPLPDDLALVAVMGGNTPGLRTFDLETLERSALIETDDRQPIGLVASPDGGRWYVSWNLDSHSDGDPRDVLAIFDPAKERFTKSRSWPDSSDVVAGVGNSRLIYDPVNDRVVTYANRATVQFFDAASLEPEGRHMIGVTEEEVVEAAVLAEGREEIYFGSYQKIHVYDLNEQEVTEAFSVEGHPVMQSSGFVELALSPDERYLYGTMFRGPGGPGTFFMMDLSSRQILTKKAVGSYAGMAVHPGGRYVYIDCPAGGMRTLIPTNKILRFDAQAREMEVFIDGPGALGLPGRALIADKITMVPGGEAFVIRNPIPARVRLDEGEEAAPSLLVVDTETKNVLTTYVPPRDEDGDVTGAVIDLAFAVVPE